MDMSRVGGGVIVYVILICALATGYSEGRRRLTGNFIGNGAGWVYSEIDEDTAEQVWMNCRQELMDMKESIVGFNEINSKSTLLTRRNIHKTISALPPQVKQSLLACLRKKKLQFGVSRKEAGSKNFFFKCFELIYSWPSAPRRYLISLPRQLVATSHAPSAAPALAPAPKLEVLSPTPSSTPSPSPQPPIETPEPSLPPDAVILPPAPSKSILTAPRLNIAPVVPLKNNNDQEDKKKRMVIIIAAAGVGAFVLAALLLFCFLKGARNKIGPQDGVKDERPLLNFSLSDFSAGSSQKSHSLGNSSNKDFGINSGKNPSLTSNLSIVSDLVAETPSPEGMLGNINSSTSLPPLKPPPGRSAPAPPGPPPLPPPKPAPRPPAPPKGGRLPPAPPTSLPGNLKKAQPLPLGPHLRGQNTSSEGDDTNGDSDAPKAKLKPFFWDKVLASPDNSMVWHEISAGSFQFNEEMIETLFGYTPERNKNNRKTESSSSLEAFPQYIQIIDSRKAQNLSILIRALNVTTKEVCDALREGDELPTELVQTLLKMAPTTDEELKLRLFSGDPSHLGPAERFLKVLVEIPFAFKRLESLLLKSSLQEEVANVKESFATLEVACNKLRNSRLFLKLLEAVLKTGNRMNDGTYRGGAQAFRLDTLLKLSDVKGTDGKTTLLHFVVQEIIRSEGVRAARTARESQSISSIKSEDYAEESSHETAEHYRSLGLQVVSGVSTELEYVKKAAVIDTDGLTATVSKLGHSLMKTKNFLNFEMQNLDEDSEFYRTVSRFVKQAEADVTWLLEEDKRIMTLVKSTADYFHGHAGKDEGLRLFVIVRDFLVMLDKACKEVRDTAEKRPKMVPRKEASALPESTEARQTQLSDLHQRLFPAIKDRRMDSFSSDDESPSP